MHIPHMRTPLIITWLLALAAAGVLGGFTIPGWTFLTGLGLFPLVVLRRIDREPALTLSESIQAARR